MPDPGSHGIHRDDRTGHGPRVLVIDDEEPVLQDLLHQLRQDSRLGPVDGATHGLTALRYLAQATEAGTPPDAVFLDVRMPGLSGPDLARLLSRFATPPMIVFVTAHGDFAVDAFELKAVDYLLKPVRTERLAEAVRRVLLALEQRAAPESPLPPPPRPAADELISVELAGITRTVPLSAVRWAEAQGDYVRLHTAKGSHLVRAALATLEKRWADSGFVRIHRSRLVALQAITALRVEGGAMTVCLDEVVLAVSRRHAGQVRDLLVRQAGISSRRR
ncbi:LytR/AlgR family response regulator transcription factor [Crossiella cryophila]|uniref:DNA-binding LytR/AlgR family response regulator n=1 Tax=Crossiella cryophila TaxID=43355 RepID=A0A7W7CD73_9PSEU|nr:response regulator transcription factor [Crossiella cryophila]MBB4678974.1 DNA-binding LytR/AlgR family response regulator [Crossiella cryophila]